MIHILKNYEPDSHHYEYFFSGYDQDDFAVEACERMTAGGVIVDQPHAFRGNFAIWIKPLPSPGLALFSSRLLN